MNHLFSWSIAGQLLTTLILLLFGHFLAKRTANLVTKPIAPRQSLQSLLKFTTFSLIRLYFWVLLFWISVGVGETVDLPFHLLKTVGSLLSAWTAIQLTSSALGPHPLSKTIATFLWVIAILNITGYLTPLTQLLAKTTFSLGNIKFSLLHLVKSIIACSVILWFVLVITKVIEKRFRQLQGLTPAQKVLFTKLSNITIYTIATITSLNILGLDLSTFALFSGALGLGIGFGLQKIFSNLISGIILLLDKSVKPGDVITVGDTYGWINSLGARCISVLTRDGKEHLIPNEILITNPVENWSYSNSNVRIRIPIGVAYNSDLHKVKELLLKAANSHPRVLKSPPPQCLIRNFGDSAIEHELRLWINDPESGDGSIKSAIYYAIWDLFQEHNVQIPFPQCEVTLTTNNSNINHLNSHKKK